MLKQIQVIMQVPRDKLALYVVPDSDFPQTGVELQFPPAPHTAVLFPSRVNLLLQ